MFPCGRGAAAATGPGEGGPFVAPGRFDQNRPLGGAGETSRAAWRHESALSHGTPCADDRAGTAESG